MEVKVIVDNTTTATDISHNLNENDLLNNHSILKQSPKTDTIISKNEVNNVVEANVVEPKDENENANENENEYETKPKTETETETKNDTETMPTPNPNPNSTLDTPKVRLLTFNIFMRPPPIHSFESDFKEDRIKLICKQIFHNYDIIAFQECFSFGSTRIDKIKEKAKKRGLLYFSNSKKKRAWNIGIDGGLCLLSRFPVVNKKLYYFKNGCHSDAYSEKGVLFNEIELPSGHHLYLFTTHTQASYEHFPSMTSESVRVRLCQFTEIRKFITETTVQAKPTDLILLCGDLNVNGRLNKEDGASHSEEYQAVFSILKGRLSVLKKDEGYAEVMSDTSEYDVEDLFYNEFQEHPVTSCDLFPDEYYKDGKGKKSRKCLDYFFKLTKIDSPHTPVPANPSSNHSSPTTTASDQPLTPTSPEDSVMPSQENHPSRPPDLGPTPTSETTSETTPAPTSNLSIEDLTINTFDVMDKKFIHLSDHYGLSLNIVAK